MHMHVCSGFFIYLLLYNRIRAFWLSVLRISFALVLYTMSKHKANRIFWHLSQMALRLCVSESVCVRMEETLLNIVRFSFPLWSSRLPVTTALCTLDKSSFHAYIHFHTCTHTKETFLSQKNVA